MKFYNSITFKNPTHKQIIDFMNLDITYVGTENYMGLAYFWNYEYRHYLRDASKKERQEIHSKWIENGLELTGVSEKHLEIIKQVIKVK